SAEGKNLDFASANLDFVALHLDFVAPDFGFPPTGSRAASSRLSRPAVAAHEAHDRAERRLERRHHDAGVDADAMERAPVGVLDLDVACGGGVGAAADRVLVI